MADPEGQRDVPESSMASAAGTTAPASSALENDGLSENSAGSGNPAYWCYQCRKQVIVEAESSGSEQGPSAGMICTECRSGFVEAVSTAHIDDVRHQDGGRAAAIVTTPARRRRRRANGNAPTQTLSLSEALGQLYPQQLVQVLQLLGQAARANDNNSSNNNNELQQHQQQDREGEASAENDGSGASQGRVLIVSEEDQDDNREVALHHDTNLWGEEEDDDGESESDVEEGMQLRLEDLDSVDEDDEIEDEDDEDEWEEVEDEDGAAGEGGGEENAVEDEVGAGHNEQQQQQSEDQQQEHHHRRNGRGRREAHATRGPRNLHRYLQELLQNLVGQNIEVRVEVPEYVGNPGDYVDARGFQLLMQQLAENDNSRRGAPPAAKSAVNRLPSILIEQSHLDDDSAVCAVCKDTVCLGEPAKQMPCLHLYHAECILPWLSTRNSCPVCRYELPTDDPDYEDQKQNQRSRARTQSASSQTVRSSSEQSEASDVGGVVSGDVASTSRQVEQEQQEVDAGVVSSGGAAEGGDLQQGVPRAVRLRRARPSSGRGWLLLTAGPVISMVGLVLVICLGNHLMGSSSSSSQQQGGSGGGGGDVPRQQLQEPCLDAGSSDSQSRRRWWWLPFQHR